MSDPSVPFNRQAVRRHRSRAARNFADHDFLFRAAAERLADRLDDIKRDFPLALDLGCHTGLLGGLLGGRGGIETLVQSDLSEAMARAARGAGRPAFAADEEFLPIARGSLDLVISCLGLHWVNDLPGALIQLRRALKPDGLLLVSLLGGETLNELRQSLSLAEIEVEGGAGPRVSPFADTSALGGLLMRAGFALPVVDSERITVTFAAPEKLMEDLRGMGESNAVNERRRSFSRRATLAAAARIYREIHADGDGRIPATFEIITLTAWAPDASQPQPMPRGSADFSLADAVGPAAADPAEPGD